MATRGRRHMVEALCIMILLHGGCDVAHKPVRSEVAWIDLGHAATAVESESPSVARAIRRACRGLEETGISIRARDALGECSTGIAFATIGVPLGDAGGYDPKTRALRPGVPPPDPHDISIGALYVGLLNDTIRIVGNIPMTSYNPRDTEHYGGFHLHDNFMGVLYLEMEQLSPETEAGSRSERLLDEICRQTPSWFSPSESLGGAHIAVLQTWRKGKLTASVSVESIADMIVRPPEHKILFSETDKRIAAISELYGLMWAIAVVRNPWQWRKRGADSGSPGSRDP